jgi:putative permease
LLFDPLHRRMQARGLPRAAAVGLTFLLFLALFFGVIALVVPRAIAQITELLRNWDQYGENLRISADTWAAGNADLLARLNVPPTAAEAWYQYQDTITGYLQVLLQRLIAALQASAGMLAWLLLLPIVTLYLMMDLDSVRARAYHVIPVEHRQAALDLTAKVGGVFTAYLRGLTMICVAFALCVYLILEIGFGVRYAVILALLAGIAYAVPYIGQLTLLIVTATVAWASQHSPLQVLGMVGSIALVNQCFDSLITPRVVGKQVGLHPVTGLFALMVGANLFGFAGMVLAVPVAASLKVVLVHLFPRLGEPIPRAGAKAVLVTQRVKEEVDAALQVEAPSSAEPASVEPPELLPAEAERSTDTADLSGVRD